MRNLPPQIAREHRPYILLIDDDQDDIEILSTSLEVLGVTTKSFDSGEKAVFYLKLVSDILELPSLIILDYNMPKINGREILLLLKDDNHTRHIPVVVYSTSMPPVFKKTLQDLGAFDCFVKPCTYSGFASQVEVFKELSYHLSNRT